MLRFIDSNGTECESELVSRTLAIDMESYLRIPRKLIVASGCEKSHTLKAALRGQLADVLIIDSALARALYDIGGGVPAYGE